MYVTETSEEAEGAIVRYFFPTGTFTRTTTPRSCRYDGGNLSLVFAARPIREGLMRIIGQFKAHVRSRVAGGNVVRQRFDPPKYWGIGNLRCDWVECVELDLSAAYLTAAFKIGAIAPWMHKRIYELAKSSRLVVVGSLGTRKTVEEFCDGKRVGVRQEQDAELRAVWDRITAEVDRVMREAQKVAGGGDFLFYWTDAVMVRTKAAPVVRDVLSRAGYSWKEISCRVRRYKSYVVAEDGRFFPLCSSAARQKDEPMILEQWDSGIKIKEAMV